MSQYSAEEYNPALFEKKWQDFWETEKLFQVDSANTLNKYYCLMMFPYPSGTLHVGHGRNYILGDALARYKKMRGLNVLAPMGWDAFGLPAENAAIKAGIHPSQYTAKNIATLKRQLKEWGVCYDWSREIASCMPDYYKWTQWLFLQLYKHGLAYKKMAPVNWCPRCNTVLANEQVIEGACERCMTPVIMKELEQWFFNITSYAQRLLDDLDLLQGWPEKVKTMQRNWIGRSEGAEVHFTIEGTAQPFSLFTTRPDTLYGVTFVSCAPEHPLVPELITGLPEEKSVRDFIDKYKAKAALRSRDQGSFEEEKEGVFTGRYAINPVNGERVPIWVANYALMEYGTGIVMAVPAHDQRDFEFARQYHLPIHVVITPDGKNSNADAMKEAYVDDGVMDHAVREIG